MDNYELLEYNLAEFMTSDMQEEFLQFFHFQNINEFKEQYVHSKKLLKDQNEEMLNELKEWRQVDSIEKFSQQVTIKLTEQYFMKYPNLIKYKNVSNNINENLCKDIHEILLRTIVYDFNLLKSQLQKLSVKSYIRNYLSNEKYVTGLFQRFPVLFNLIDKKIKETICYISEVIQHVEYDSKEINELFSIQLDQEIGVEFSLGDPHLSGKFPLVITGKKNKIIYKPRSNYNDLLFGECVALFNKNNFNKQLAQIKLLNRKTYSWSEFIVSDPCQSEEEVQDFYYKMGAIIAILFYLNASDIHLENLIASGGSPMLIDLECLFNNLDRMEALSVNDKIHEILTNSVLNSGIVPMYNEFFKDDISALGSHENLFQRFSVPQLIVSEDDLEIKFTENSDEFKYSYSNVPMYHGQNYRFLDYKQQIYQGFTETFHLFLDKKSELIDIVERYKNDITIRHLIKPTATYSKIATLSYHPRFLTAPFDRLLFVYSQMVRFGSTPFLTYEIEDILEGDIPYVFSKLNSNTLNISKKMTFTNNSRIDFLTLWKKKIHSLSEKDLNYQLNILQKSFGDKNITLENLFIIGEKNDEIKTLESYIHSKRIVHNKQVTWLHTGYEDLTKDKDFKIRLKLQPMNNSLYNGKIGVAITYYYLWKTKNDFDYKNRFLLILNDLLDHFDLSNQKNYDIGVFSGLGGYIYLFNLIAPSLRTSKLIAIEQDILQYLGQKIKKDKILDIMSGTAGLLLLFCNIYKKSPNKELKKLIGLCVENLLNNLIESEGKGSYWESSVEKKLILGFSHGTSGILYALAIYEELFSVTKIKETIGAVTLFENQHRKNGVWFDTRGEKWIEQNTFYCNGLVGMLTHRYLMEGESPEELLYFARLKEELNKERVDSCLCHGFLGNMWLYRHFFIHHNIKSYAFLLDDWNAYLDKRTINESCLEDEFLDVGLMTGLSGVILGLLALENPNIPNILLFDL
ncbi:type 2 lantipeptide synthetase LanM [Enterococcus hirae]|uniref:type 2 lanthipeptide synthetase LanM n=1 Tax=Enterococcus hirae TaxID=1354 RepID=UPI002073F78E|nr:type 2 lanthipeptide synthetase LanM [Enterococcus hirae]EMF0201790.1 type 2 lantipeptide synthetase LanM [Enterococcus hirae]